MTLAGPDTVDAHEAAAGTGEAGAAAKRAYVRQIFGQIAPRYDLLNRVLSFNIDGAWRGKAIDALEWRRAPVGTYLDLCSGTLDIAVKLASQSQFGGRVMATDFAEPMLRVALHKARGRPVVPLVADALSLPILDASVDGAMVAFGIRNLSDLDAGLAEVFRVLAPGGRFVILEFSTPGNALVRGAYHAYFHHVLPVVGRVVSGHRSAYRYLPLSVANFPSPGALADRLTRAGFVNVRWQSLTFGVAAIHVADKPADAGRLTTES